jgi:1-acyl-sn-glycerol-3-phosphate acyltransferase
MIPPVHEFGERDRGDGHEVLRIIKADKRGWPRWAVHRMIVRRLQKAFHGFWAQGLEPLREALATEPSGILFVANHSSWWDLFFVHYLNTQVPVDGYGMMEHYNLRRFGFFRRIGAFSVDRTNQAAIRQSIDYTVELLRRPRAGVWIMPQGRMLANDERPLVFQRGLRSIVSRAGRVRVVCVALRYEFWQDERPEAFVRFGETRLLERAGNESVLQECEKWLTDELDSLRGDVVAQAVARFTPLGRGRVSINERYGRVRARLMGKTPGAPDDY